MQQYMNKIQSTVLFKGFMISEVQQALGCLQGTIKDFAKKDVIFKQEEYLVSAGIILQGNVLLCKENSSGMRFIFSELESGRLSGRPPFVWSRSPAATKRLQARRAGCCSSRLTKLYVRARRPAI